MPTTRKVELPADSAVYEPPADATVDELAAMAAQARQDAQALLKDDTASAEDVATAERFIAAIDAITARRGELVAEQEAQAQRVQEARARLTEPDPEQQDDEDPEKTPVPVPAAPAEGGEPSGVNPTGEPVLVADGGLKPVKDPAVRIRNAATTVARTTLPPTVDNRDKGEAAWLTAAAEVKGFHAGARLDWAQYGIAAQHRFNSLPHGTRTSEGNAVRLSIADVQIPTHDEALVASAKANSEFAEADAAIEWAVSRHRLAEATGTDGSLVAAGGWCAPSETLYDLLDITTDDGLLDVPGITVNRGGVRYSLGPDFTAVYVTGNANFTRTETQAIAGTPTKPMVNIPCPTFTDNRMLVDGLYLTGDILSSKGYPEAYTDYTQKALKAFAHYVNAQSIIDIVALSGSLIDLSTSTGTLPVTNRTGSATVELLGAVELQVTDMRYKNRLSMTQAVEVIMPFWLRGNIRSDLAKRQGMDNGFMISDADIRSWFALRGASIQFVYDWQDAFTGVGSGFGAATAIAGWPTTANFLIYPQGTFVRALEPVIELSAVYDSTLLQTNQFVQLFQEQGRLTLKRHWDARYVKVAVAPLGGTSTGSPVGAAGLTGSVL